MTYQHIDLGDKPRAGRTTTAISIVQGHLRMGVASMYVTATEEDRERVSRMWGVGLQNVLTYDRLLHNPSLLQHTRVLALDNLGFAAADTRARVQALVDSRQIRILVTSW